MSIDIPNISISIWLVPWNIFLFFPYIGNAIIPTDELHHFSEGFLSTTNQKIPWKITIKSLTKITQKQSPMHHFFHEITIQSPSNHHQILHQISLKSPFNSHKSSWSHHQVTIQSLEIIMYHLVNVYITVEIQYFWGLNQRTNWPWSIAQLVYQRIYLIIPLLTHY